MSVRQSVLLANRDRVTRSEAKVLAARAEVLQRDEAGPPVRVVLAVPMPCPGGLLPRGATLSTNLLHATALHLVGAAVIQGELDQGAVSVIGPAPQGASIEWANQFRPEMPHAELRAVRAPNTGRFRRS